MEATEGRGGDKRHRESRAQSTGTVFRLGRLGDQGVIFGYPWDGRLWSL